MAYDIPCLSYITLYIISLHIINTNQRTSTHWKLNPDEGKVQATVADGSISDDFFMTGSIGDDVLMNILTNKIIDENGDWKLDGENVCNDNCKNTASKNEEGGYDKMNIGIIGSSDNESKLDEKVKQKPIDSKAKQNSTKSKISKEKLANVDKSTSKKKKYTLDCGKVVNYTEYDRLRGIANRHNHPHIPEPEVAMIFRKKGVRNTEVDMNELEKRLRKSRKEKPRSAQVYNQIGNFWRIKGDAQMSIDCFRKALHFSADNADVLLNLARVLFNLQYLDDAIELTKKSLERQPPDQNSWLQHFTLGEIMKAYGHFRDAALHFRHALDLNPGFQPAQAHLRDMESSPDGTVTYYTLFIILFLVLGVLCGILTSIDGSLDDLTERSKVSRSCNRAMAMRSIKLGTNARFSRIRRQYNG